MNSVGAYTTGKKKFKKSNQTNLFSEREEAYNSISLSLNKNNNMLYKEWINYIKTLLS